MGGVVKHVGFVSVTISI